MSLVEQYYEQTLKMFDVVDLSRRGNTRKTFNDKYQMILDNIMLSLACHNMISDSTVYITLWKYDGHHHYYDFDTNSIYTNGVKLGLTQFHQVCINELLKDYPDRIYMFHGCTQIPSELNVKDKKVMSTQSSVLVKRVTGQSIKTLKAVTNYVKMEPMFKDAMRRMFKLEFENRELKQELKEIKAQVSQIELKATQLKNIGRV